MSCFSHMRDIQDLFGFQVRSALLRCILLDTSNVYVFTQSHRVASVMHFFFNFEDANNIYHVAQKWPRAQQIAQQSSPHPFFFGMIASTPLVVQFFYQHGLWNMLKHETVVFTAIKCTSSSFKKRTCVWDLACSDRSPGPLCKYIIKCTQSVYYHTVQVWRLNIWRSFFG